MTRARDNANTSIFGTPSVTLGSDATGDVYYRAAGGALTRLATGADGTVLTSTGAAAVPAFEAIPASGGKVLQVVTTTTTVTYTESIGANTLSTVLVTGLQAAITPAATSSKILIIINLTTGFSSGGAVGDVHGFLLKRGTTGISIATSAGSRTPITTASWLGASEQFIQIGFNYVDSPSTTSATTYAISFFNGSGVTSDLYLNRSDRDTDGTYTARGTSTITLMEIGA